MSSPQAHRPDVDSSAKVDSLISVALEFVERINAGDPDELMALMTEDFTFVDKSGNVYRGRQRWDYFSSYPEYRIHVKHVLTGGNGVAIIGRTTGSHIPPEVESKETLLWTAEIRDGLVAEWRIYSDIEDVKKMVNEPPQEMHTQET